MTKLNIKLEYFAKKKKEELKLKKIERKTFNFLGEIATKCKLIIKSSILSDQESVVFYFDL